MFKKIKHITAIIMLVIFPISAIGLNISIHKCKLKGTTQFTFVDNSNKNNSVSSCCGHDEQILTNGGDCCNNDQKESIDSDNDSNNESCSCEEPADISSKPDNPNKSTETDKLNNECVYDNFSESCCTHSNYSYELIVNTVDLETKKPLFDLPVFYTDCFEKINLTTKGFNNFTIKDVQHPLKKPISCIISFIHFTSDTSEDSDSYNYYLL
jgi:hypothetical protein